jgi:hypothetical protein
MYQTLLLQGLLQQGTLLTGINVVTSCFAACYAKRLLNCPLQLLLLTTVVGWEEPGLP